jgi:hypothetical protein
MTFRNELERLSLASFTSLVLFAGKAGAYLSEAPIRCPL